ncbi:peptidylprolyl isomerase [Stappia sp. GBMRC 2046]|uniref:Parvulin-like PPIase n=2 Tax=Stappia sediminis TaxID=2692190 RepID=A0A7X3LU82_9HYPH|nr:peptidylprolyl isomerase [Stappia sediminis]
MLAGFMAVAAFGIITAPMAAQEAAAQEADDVLAKVGDREVTEADIAFASQEFAGQLRNIPPNQWRSILTDTVVDMEVMAAAARQAGIDKEPDFERQMDFLRMRALRNAYIVREVEDKVTEADVKAAYDKEFESYSGEEEVSARHILLETEEDAKAVIDELDAGKDFAELAKEKSTGPSGPNGGDLGYFTKGRMVPEFEEAAFAMEKGAHSAEPVKTQFGWHVIKVEDRRTQPAPELPAVEQRIRQDLVRAKYAEVLEKLKSETQIEITDPTLKADGEGTVEEAPEKSEN